MTEKHIIGNNGYLKVLEHMGSDTHVANSARVSYNEKDKTEQQDNRLINFLMGHDHLSPLEHCILTLEVQAPFFVVSQWHRHRMQSYSQVSGRYKNLVEQGFSFYLPDEDYITIKSETNKQCRTDEKHSNASRIRDIMQYSMEQSVNNYDQLCRYECPLELARMVLPLAQYTKFQTTLNLRYFYHFIKLRRANDAQKEIRDYAEAMLLEAKKHFPVTTEAYLKYEDKILL
ncbi:thymidylate synthase, flavin-dependent [Flavobacteriaceae bacterium (ex Bugula neritina AB1)]|nr:thymidylate synthase, flavin-dependent [Flavobacteriaceae bacterium (ex Bugula neritina AB1)]